MNIFSCFFFQLLQFDYFICTSVARMRDRIMCCKHQIKHKTFVFVYHMDHIFLYCVSSNVLCFLRNEICITPIWIVWLAFPLCVMVFELELIFYQCVKSYTVADFVTTIILCSFLSLKLTISYVLKTTPVKKFVDWRHSMWFHRWTKREFQVYEYVCVNFHLSCVWDY